MFQYIIDDFPTGRGATKIAGVHTLINSLVDRVLYNDGVVFVTQMTQHIDRSVQHRYGIRYVLAGDAGAGVASPRLEDRVMIAVILAGQQTSAAQQTAHHVRHDGSVEIGRQYDVELMRVRNELHATVVYDHVVVDNVRVILGDSSRGLQKEPVRQLHDVRFVDRGNFLPAIPLGVIKRVTRDTLRVGARDDFHALDDAVDALVLQHGVLALGVLPDDHYVDILLAGVDTRIGHAMQDVHIQIQLVP